MATASAIDEINLETYTLIWLDISSTVLEENHHIEQSLRALINDFKIFENIHRCEKYIQSLSAHERIVLIIHNCNNQDFINHIHELPQVYSIYIHVQHKKQNPAWINQYPKIKGITTQLNKLLTRIQADHERGYENLSINIFTTNIDDEMSTIGLNGQFLHFQLLIYVLLRLKSTSQDKNQLISLCKKEYQNNGTELTVLHEFEQTYSSNQVIWWYTRQSFLFKVLNKALRTQNINLLFFFRFFIHDIEQQLQSHPCSSPIRVYRGNSISNEEFETLKNSIGQYISMNSFVSTSLSRKQALSFLRPKPNFQQVLFEIDADPSPKNIKPFSNITNESYYPAEEEVLFMLGSIFRIIKIDSNEKNIWIIRMTLCSNDEHNVKTMFDHMKKQYGDGKTNLLAFGKVLWTMGKFNDAQRYFLRLLNELSEDHPYISYCYRALGTVADDKGDSENSLKWHFKAIDIMTHRSDTDNSLLGESLNSIGCIYDSKGDYKRALEFYKKAYQIWKEIYGDDHLKIAICLNNIACIYAERKQYQKALQYYQNVLTIREKHLPSNHADIGASYNNLGEIYRCLGQYESALENLNIALKIYRLSLPSQHPDRAEVLMNIGLVYQNENNKEQALDYYEKASKIYHKTLRSTHSSVRKIDRLIQDLHSV